MKIDVEKYREHSDYINEIKHDTEDLIIWNYNHKTQFDNAWNEYTETARGLITESDGTIVARPFRKFFNIDQRPETMIEELVKLGEPKAYEKMDGSLGILYFADGRPQIATRGSFNSDQAKWASEWLLSRPIPGGLLVGCTYLFEIIYPENRIVVNYGDRAELVLLAVIHIETGEEQDYVAEAKRLGWSYAKPFEGNYKAIMDRVTEMKDEGEGFVLKYSNGLRVKIKSEEYKRLHKLLTGFSNKSIWELLANDQPLDELLERVPDEFYDWVKTVKDDLEKRFNDLWKYAQVAHSGAVQLPDRKTQAIWINKYHKEIAGIVFFMLDDKDPAKLIWKSLKPQYSKPFKIDIDQ